MNTELVDLLLTAVLTGVLWIPVVIGYVKTRGPLTPGGQPACPPPIDSCRRGRHSAPTFAHQNAVETLRGRSRRSSSSGQLMNVHTD